MAVLNRQTAVTADTFHADTTCAQRVTVGPRGGRTVPRVENYRRNGRTQTWITRPDDYSIPVKYGLRDAFRITDRDTHAGGIHTGRAEDCTLGTLRDSLALAFPPVARCGRSDAHTYHRYAPGPGGACVGNLNVITAVTAAPTA